MSDLLTKPAVELLSLLNARKISPFELAEEHILQIERLNPRLNALIDFDPDRVRAQATALEHSSAPKGPLHGLPITVKASISVAGHRCETGSVLNKNHTPAEDAVIVARARKAGAVILSTTNCPEFLMAYETDNRLYGRTSNPWDLTRTAGGSSGGESAAIAAGMSASGFGSDGGGSVREPSHFTGICALKPTPGRIPAAGHLPPCVGPFSLIGTVGPMARTIADLSLIYSIISGQDETDPTGAPIAPHTYTEDDLKRIPIGFFEDDGHTPVTPETRQAIQEAVCSLRQQGFQVEPFRPRALEQARQLWWKFFVRCGAMFFEPVIQGRESDLSPTLQGFLEIARKDPPLTGNELLQAWSESDLIRRKLLEEMRHFPILITPVCATPAFRHGERSWNIDGHEVEYLDAMRYTQWFNLLGSPAAVVPINRSTEGLPIGIQIAGRPHEDELVLAIAAAIERDFGYTPPPMAHTA